MEREASSTTLRLVSESSHIHTVEGLRFCTESSQYFNRHTMTYHLFEVVTVVTVP